MHDSDIIQAATALHEWADMNGWTAREVLLLPVPTPPIGTMYARFRREDGSVGYAINEGAGAGWEMCPEDAAPESLRPNRSPGSQIDLMLYTFPDPRPPRFTMVRDLDIGEVKPGDFIDAHQPGPTIKFRSPYMNRRTHEAPDLEEIAEAWDTYPEVINEANALQHLIRMDRRGRVDIPLLIAEIRWLRRQRDNT